MKDDNTQERHPMQVVSMRHKRRVEINIRSGDIPYRIQLSTTGSLSILYTSHRALLMMWDSRS